MAPAQQIPDLTTFKALSFDCYGTLIDWQKGIIQNLDPVLSQLPADHPFRAQPLRAVERFADISEAIEREQPTLVYNENLAMAAAQFCRTLGVPPSDALAEPIGNAPGTWGPFPDTIPGLLKLQERYKLIILSNINNANIKSTVDDRLAPVKFAGVYTAQDIGAYKPDHATFRYLFKHAKEELDVDWEKGDLLHVAVSLTADLVPAKALGLRSVWITRGSDQPGGGRTSTGAIEKLRDQVNHEWQFESIGEFAAEVERQFATKGQSS